MEKSVSLLEVTSKLENLQKSGEKFLRHIRGKRRPPVADASGTTPLVGGTRGGAKDASERVKAQAVILFYKKCAAGATKMAAYAFAARHTNNSERSVQG